MADTKIAVTGIYPTQASLESGAFSLRNAGFRSSDISVLYSESPGVPGRDPTNMKNASEGRAAGAGSGGAAVGFLGWLPGIGSLTIPGLGAFIAAGHIVSAINNTSTSEAVDGLASGLVALGLTASDANTFRGEVVDGATLISVHSDNGYWAKRAKEILERTGARNILITGKDNRSFGMGGIPSRVWLKSKRRLNHRYRTVGQAIILGLGLRSPYECVHACLMVHACNLHSPVIRFSE